MESEAYADFTPVLTKGKVDIVFTGHWHYYNRYKPFNNMTGDVDEACISADGATYTNPKYITYIISGASGDKEDDSPYVVDHPSYTGCVSRRAAALAPVPCARKSSPAPPPTTPPPPTHQHAKLRLWPIHGC